MVLNLRNGKMYNRFQSCSQKPNFVQFAYIVRLAQEFSSPKVRFFYSIKCMSLVVDDADDELTSQY